MKGLKIFLLIIISILVVLCGWAYLAGMSAEQTVLSNSYYQGLVDETNLVSAIHEELQNTLPDMMLEGMTEDLPDGITPEEEEMMQTRLRLIVTAFTESFDTAWLEKQLLTVTDDLIALVKGEQQTLTATINLKEGKENFRNNLINAVEALPDNVREELDMQEDQVEAMADQIITEMDLPDELSLAGLLEEDVLTAEMDDTLSTIQNYRSYSYFSYLIFALLLLFSCLLAGLAGGLKWFGAAAMFFSVTYLLGLQLIRTVFPAMIFAGVEGEPPFSTGLLHSVIDYTVAAATFVPLVSAAVGLVMITAGLVFNKIMRKPQDNIY